MQKNEIKNKKKAKKKNLNLKLLPKVMRKQKEAGWEVKMRA